MTFLKGASLKAPARLFNAEGNARRAIHFRETDNLDEVASKDLIQAAVVANVSGRKKL